MSIRFDSKTPLNRVRSRSLDQRRFKSVRFEDTYYPNDKSDDDDVVYEDWYEYTLPTQTKYENYSNISVVPVENTANNSVKSYRSNTITDNNDNISRININDYNQNQIRKSTIEYRYEVNVSDDYNSLNKIPKNAEYLYKVNVSDDYNSLNKIPINVEYKDTNKKITKVCYQINNDAEPIRLEVIPITRKQPNQLKYESYSRNDYDSKPTYSRPIMATDNRLRRSFSNGSLNSLVNDEYYKAYNYKYTLDSTAPTRQIRFHDNSNHDLNELFDRRFREMKRDFEALQNNTFLRQTQF